MEKTFIMALLPIIFLFGCKQRSTEKEQEQHEKADSTHLLLYAEGFSIDYFKNYKRITIINPWENKTVYTRYYLVSDKETPTPHDGQKITIPLKTIAVASNTHFDFLQMIYELGSIKGICSPEKIYNQTILNKYKQGKLRNMGDPFSLNIEEVQMLYPDAVTVSASKQEDPVGKRLTENGIPVLYINEWMETSLLGRAEWIKFIAAFYNKETLADSIFSSIVNNYQTSKNKLKAVKHKPTVLIGRNFKGTWYMPGGRSYMANLLHDAGANYYYKHETTTGSIPLNFEVVLNNFKEAEVWIGCQSNNIEELLSADERHGLFLAAQTRNAYNFNKRTTETGGNDFWESGITHPDIILKDLIKVLHPELMKDYEFVYVHKLK